VVVRSRSLIRALALAGALLAASAAPASSQMAIAQKVLADFAADGVIDPCKHSSDELRLVLKNIPPEFEQYAPDYPAAVKAALEARARGECAGKKPEAPVAVPTATATPAPAATPKPTPVPTAIPTKTVVPEPPEPEKVAVSATATATPGSARSDGALERVATARAANSAPAPVLLLALLSALLALGALFLLAMRRGGWEHGRMAPVAHAWREASFRVGGLWEDFRDWLRVGR
jgi:hypothetical protein